MSSFFFEVVRDWGKICLCLELELVERGEDIGLGGFIFKGDFEGRRKGFLSYFSELWW